MTKQLRKYQEKACKAFAEWYNTECKSFELNDRLSTMILAMGLGKTFTSACCINDLYKVSKPKVLWCAHREELIDQAFEELSSIIKNVDIQVEMAEKKASSSADIIIGSVQTLYRKRPNLKDFIPDLIVIDEFHHYHKDNTQYHGLIEAYPNSKILGLTATPYRFAGGDLPTGKQLINVDIGLGISRGYLVQPKPEVINTNTSIAHVKTRAGDFATDQLSEAVDNEERNWLICKRLIQAVHDEKRYGILYAASVSHAKNMANMLRKAGLSVAEIYGETPKDERRDLLKKIHNKEIDITVNNLVMTEGTNIPHINLICIARPTKSLGLYSQSIGRGLRLDDNKIDCLIIDVFDRIKVTQNIASYSKVASVGDIDGSRKRAEAIMKEKFADKLSNFPVVMKLGKDEIWQIDNKTWFASSWILDTNQWVITWSKRSERTKTDSFEWKQIKYTPKKTELNSKPIEVKHFKYGEGIANDIIYGSETHYISVNFGVSGIKNIPISELQTKQTVYENKSLNNIIRRAFYVITNDTKSYNRIIALKKEGIYFSVESDIKGDETTINEVIKSFANEDDMIPVLKRDAPWKKKPASTKQKDLIKNFMMWGKLKPNMIDLESLTGGDASALMDQVEWKPVINNLFSADKKEKLIGHLKEFDDV